MVRIAGADRYEVSAAISASIAYPRLPVPVAYVVSGEAFPDALSASAVAGTLGGPVLLVTKSTIPDAIRAELTRIKPRKIIVLGGANSIDASVEAQLGAYSSSVNRIAGADRYEVSALASAGVFEVAPTGPGVDTLFLASGESYPDALSGAPATAATREGALPGPLLLTRRGDLPAVVEAEIRRLRPERIIILGGANTISDEVLAKLRTIQPAAFRIGGTDRYDTSIAISSFVGQSDTIYVTSGQNFPDALSGGPAGIIGRSPVFLTSPNAIPASLATYLSRPENKPKRIIILGGPSSVSPAVEAGFAAYLAP
ncbi:hypothetical protein GCM10009851_18720 [Herbiconiux moechotypicola]|uniref:Cell wall-binding repeat-containing protein n=2 Tax=Herbiconiux moechotypicola TaxID=637393 RepID=A0ABP5QFI5_9MICO